MLRKSYVLLKGINKPEIKKLFNEARSVEEIIQRIVSN
jgi:hypothetical protein